jgi:hypothetical protein
MFGRETHLSPVLECSLWGLEGGQEIMLYSSLKYSLKVGGWGSKEKKGGSFLPEVTWEQVLGEEIQVWRRYR